MTAILDRPSPNHGERRDGPVDMLILHYTGMPTAEAALQRLCDPAAQVSAHYLIGENGTIWRLVDESRRAWHAGAAWWAGCADVNSRSIGIELANAGHDGGLPPFPAAQMAALIDLARGILHRHAIPPWRVLGHSDVAPERKQDPGERFDWAALARAGIGVFPALLSASPAMGEGRGGGDAAASSRHMRPPSPPPDLPIKGEEKRLWRRCSAGSAIATQVGPRSQRSSAIGGRRGSMAWRMTKRSRSPR